MLSLSTPLSTYSTIHNLVNYRELDISSKHTILLCHLHPQFYLIKPLLTTSQLHKHLQNYTTEIQQSLYLLLPLHNAIAQNPNTTSTKCKHNPPFRPQPIIYTLNYTPSISQPHFNSFKTPQLLSIPQICNSDKTPYIHILSSYLSTHTTTFIKFHYIYQPCSSRRIAWSLKLVSTLETDVQPSFLFLL